MYLVIIRLRRVAPGAGNRECSETSQSEWDLFMENNQEFAGAVFLTWAMRVIYLGIIFLSMFFHFLLLKYGQSLGNLWWVLQYKYMFVYCYFSFCTFTFSLSYLLIYIYLVHSSLWRLSLSLFVNVATFMCFSVPDPPTHLRAVNVTDSSALLLWRPALAAIDKYSIVYGAGTGEQCWYKHIMSASKCVPVTSLCCCCMFDYFPSRPQNDFIKWKPWVKHPVWWSCWPEQWWYWEAVCLCRFRGQGHGVWKCSRAAAHRSGGIHHLHCDSNQPAGQPGELAGHHHLHHKWR